MIVHDRLYIGGELVAPEGTGTIDVINPFTEEVCGRVPEATTADVDKAVAVARSTFDAGEWAKVLDHAILSVMGEPHDPKKDKPATRILAVSENGTAFKVELRFQTGKTYCCSEPCCFMPTFCKSWWTRLRTAIAEKSDRIPPPMKVTINNASSRRNPALQPPGALISGFIAIVRASPMRS